VERDGVREAPPEHDHAPRAGEALGGGLKRGQVEVAVAALQVLDLALVDGLDRVGLGGARVGKDQVAPRRHGAQVGGARRFLQLGVALVADVLREAHDRGAVHAQVVGELRAGEEPPALELLHQVRGQPPLLRGQLIGRRVEPL